jgi:hypothetical protein
MHTDTQDIEFQAHINAEFREVGNPMLLGETAINGQRLQFVAWENTTRDGRRVYYSCSICDLDERQRLRANTPKGEKIQQTALAKFKCYEFRQRSTDDPDFASKDSFVLSDETFYAAMWVDNGADSDDPDQLSFTVNFSHEPVRQALTPQAKESVEHLKEHLGKRRAKLAEAAQTESGEDSLPF